MTGRVSTPRRGAGRGPLAVLAAGRCALGAAGLVRPAALARALGVDRVTAERTAWITRMAAGRDLALGAGLLGALARGREPTGWARAGAVADGGDAVALGMALGGRQLAGGPAAALGALSASAALTGLRLAARARAGRAPATPG
ncbi:MAG TPA: hypothetical protein VKP11_11315 [Frankiaceae bacterium]|nr:hypothetical protein [Frankiaceae bacterium]